MAHLPFKIHSVRPNRYTLYGLIAVLLWSTTIAVVRSLAEQIGSLTAAVFVYLLGGVLSCVFTGLLRNFKSRIGGLSRYYLWGCGVLFVLYMLALYLAVGLATDRNQVLEVGLVNYLWPALTLVFSLPILGKKARMSLIPGTLVALLGVYLVLTQGTLVSWSSLAKNVMTIPLAYSLALIAAVTWGLYSSLARRWGGPQNGGAVPLFMLATGGVLLVIRLFYSEPTLWGWRAAAEVLFMSLATAFAYVFWDMAMRKGDVVFVAACSYFIPLFSTLVSCLYLRVSPGFSLWVGCGMIILGSLISWASVSDRDTPRDG